MNRKKILIVASTFFPENWPRSIRTTELAKEFAREGHQVTVLVPKNKIVHKQFENKYNLEIKDLGKKNFKEIDIISGSKLSVLVKRIFKRSLDLFFHYPNIEWMFKVKRALKYENGYDLLITIAFPHSIHWGTAWAWRDKDKIAQTWLADCGDPFMGLENDSFKKLFYFKYFERSWGKKVTNIIVPFEGAKKSYYPEFQDKISVIPQGFSFPKLSKNKKNNNKVITFIYSGNIGSYKHYYIPFFNFLKELKISFKFIVFTKEDYIFKNELNNIINKVEINSYVSRDQLIETLVCADFLIHFPYQNSTQKSLKLIDYAFSKTPILSYHGVEDNIIFKQFLKGNYSNQLLVDNIDQYRIENVCQQFLELTS